MATQFSLPELGENVETGTVTSVLVDVGDTVVKDQPVIELETDKAVVEVPCAQEGTVSEVRVKEGEEIKVGDVILVLDGKADGEKAAEEKAPKKEEQKAPKKEKPEEVEEKKEKEQAEAKKEEEEESRPEEEASKQKEREKAEAKEEEKKEEVKAEEPTEEEGKAKKEEAEEREAEAPEPQREKVPERTGTVRAAPSVRRLAREIGIDIHVVQPSSAGAAITADDVKAYARSLHEGGQGAAVESGAYKLPNFEKWGAITREKMSTVRRMTAERTSQSWTTIPHVTQHDKADITELEKFRKEYGKLAEQEGGKLTVTAILVRVLAEGLKRYPMFNASVDMENAEIVYKEYYNIGVAVDTEWGLLVPSIKNADKKTLVDIAVELSDLSDRARQRKTSLDELQGSCMTITNLGGIGGTSFTPIVNLPEAAILGVSRATTEPAYRDGAFAPRTMMPISLSYDHRVIDGADAARFARWICQALEQPMSIFLQH